MMDEPRPTLRREVLPPPSTSSAWGLIVVAATALSCALAGSLLMVRASAEMARERTPVMIYEPPTESVHADLVRVHEPPPPPEACRGPVYHANGDGKAEAVFELCPPKHGKIKRIVAD